MILGKRHRAVSEPDDIKPLLNRVEYAEEVRRRASSEVRDALDAVRRAVEEIEQEQGQGDGDG